MTKRPLRRIEVPQMGAEDVVIDADGNAWTGTADGSIFRVTPEGSVHCVGHTGGRPLGIELYGQDRLLITSADLFSDGSRITLRSLGKREFRFSLFPGLGSGQRLVASSALRTTAFRNGLQEYTAELPPANASLNLHPIRRAGIAPTVQMGPAVSWRPHGVATAPADATFQESAATWDLRVSWPRRTEISNLFLTVDYQGDVARLQAAAARLGLGLQVPDQSRPGG